MDLSFSALVAIPTFITPALIGLFLYRIFIPSGHSFKRNDFTILMILGVFTVYLNLDLFELVAQKAYMGFYLSSTNSPESRIWYSFFQNSNIKSEFPWNVFNRLPLMKQGEVNSIWDIFILLHLRAFLFWVVLWGSIPVLEKIRDLILANNDNDKTRRRSKKRETNSNSATLDNEEGSKFISALINIFIFIIDFFQKRIYSSWSFLFTYNKNIEILMCDIHLDDGSLYMGTLSGYFQEENKLLQIALTNIIRFYPDSSSQNSISDGQNNQPKKLKRKIKFVINSGEMIFLPERIVSIHAWNLKKNTEIVHRISDDISEEYFKWYLSLMNDNSEVFSKIEVWVLYETKKESDLFITRFSEWYDKSGLDIPEDKIEIYQGTKKS
jgi:hypothetical protein